MRYALAVLIVLVGSNLHAEEPRKLHVGFYAFSVAGQAADAWSTKRFRAAGQLEAGPSRVQPDSGAFVPYKLGIGLGAAVLGDVLQRHGKARWHRRLGKVLPIAAGVVGFAAAVHNERNLRRCSSCS